LREVLETIIAITWERIEKSETQGRTVTLKLKHADFTGLTRARSLPRPVTGRTEFAALGHALLDEVLPLAQPVRLMGLTLSQLEGEDEASPAPAGGDAQLSLL
ncbi:MAG: DNA polymerase IV, partial [Novosphingobium sp.]